jgi:hypothetical protein
MQISGVSLALTWPCRLCLLSSPGRKPLLQAFPFPSTLGEGTLHPLSQACVFIYSSRVKWVFPPVLWSFPPSATCTSFPTPAAAGGLFTAQVGGGSSPLSCGVFLPLPLSQAFSLLVAGHAPPLPPSPLRPGPGLFIYSSGKASLPPLFGAQCAPPSFPRVFILIACYSVSLFSLGGGWSVQGAMLFWPRVVCGSTAYCLAHFVCIFPSRLGAGVSRPGAILVSLFNVKWRFSAQAGDSLRKLEAWRGQNFASSWWLCLQGVSPVSLQDFALGGTLSASSL